MRLLIVEVGDWAQAVLQSVRDRLPAVTAFLLLALPLLVGGRIAFRALPRLYVKRENPFVYTMQ